MTQTDTKSATSTPTKASAQSKRSSQSTDIGVRGLVIVRDPQSYEVVNEGDWRQLDYYLTEAQTGTLASLSTLHVSLARLEQSVFVDLDQLAELGAGEPVLTPGPAQKGPLPVPSGSAIILKEANKLYLVPESSWQKIPSVITGDAAVLINRKAVLAAIPKSPIASGTFCVLINFLGIDGAT